MTPADLRALARADAEAHAAFLNGLCEFAEQAAIDYRRELGAVTIKHACDLLDRSETTVRELIRSGRLEYVDRTIPLRSIDEYLRSGTRRKTRLRAVGGRT